MNLSMFFDQSAVIEAFVKISNNDKLSVTILKYISCINKICRLYLTVYAVSNALENDIYPLAKIDWFTHFAFYEFQDKG